MKRVQAVQMLTGLERFVRLVVERVSFVARSSAPATLNTSADKSPKVSLVTHERLQLKSNMYCYGLVFHQKASLFSPPPHLPPPPEHILSTGNCSL